MVYKFLFITVIFLSLAGQLNAVDDTGRFIQNHCQSSFIGESADGHNCYQRGIELFNVL